jgi:hypothetical protein
MYHLFYDCILLLMFRSPDGLIRIEVGAMLVKKRFKPQNSVLHVAHLSKIYGLLRMKVVSHTDFLRSTSTVPMFTTTHPVELGQWPNDDRDAYTVLVCV